jgi:hypothetical protein
MDGLQKTTQRNMTKTYNRNKEWTNNETKAAATWLDSDAARRDQWKQRAFECIECAPRHPRVLNGSWAVSEAPLYELSRWLGEEALPSVAGMNSAWIDLAVLAYERIDWWEIASHYLAQLPESRHCYVPFHPVHGDGPIDPLEGDQYASNADGSLDE